MPKPFDPFHNQLNGACKLSGAKWCAWIENTHGSWMAQITSTISKKRKRAVDAFLMDSQVNAWISGAIHSGRMRWRNLNPKNASLGSDRMYLFPNTSTHQALISGATELDQDAQLIFKLLAENPPPKHSIFFDREEKLIELENQSRPGIEPRATIWYEQTDQIGFHNYPTGITLDQILLHFASTIQCEAAYIAVRRGEYFHIQATWQCLPKVLGYDIQIDDVPVLAYMLETHAGVILNTLEIADQAGLPKTISPAEKSWMGLPVTIGQRVIGLFIFVSRQQEWFKPRHLNEAILQANRIAYIVENAILFEEATRYLQQLALLNELASTASVVADIDQVSRRVMQRLRRIFNIDWAAVHLLAPDEKSLREYGGKTENDSLSIHIGSGTLIDNAIRTGHPIRINNLTSETTNFKGEKLTPLFKNSISELVVPLKYSGHIIGVLSLSSNAANKFSTQDEQLLILIASNLAGLFENMRLNQETQERAAKLQVALQQLQESQRALVQSEKMATAGRLMASIAHEINNPLQAVQNCVHLAGRKELDTNARESYLVLANSELTRLMTTVQRMLEYYRPGGLDRKPIEIHELLIKTLSLVQKQLDDCSVRVVLDLADNLPPVLAVGDQIQQVFLNLILNASQAMSHGGDLRISTREGTPLNDTSRIEIHFQDSGPGISSELRTTVFEPFFSTRENGVGLGLAVSYGIITAHKGNLELSDNDNPGACFKVTLNGYTKVANETK